MKKMNVVVLLLALLVAMPSTFSFAVSEASVTQPQALAAKVNINTADEQALCQVPGIGPATAQKILVHREENGNFQRLEDLGAVKGIGPKSLEKMRPFITI